ncbi:MAG: ribbon-helix-helix protein, CopG family [Solirubrobacterales bacterium]|nr:ribbon-helix-helix protein, CopG family [Solirubrobacterales bacterium]
MATTIEQRTAVAAWIPASTAAELRARAAKEDRSLSAEIRRALNRYLAAPERPS